MLPSFLAMHIPDGFLNIPVSAIGWALLILILAKALRQAQTQLGERQVPLMGILAAFVFAAQMINFPVAGGTSGHMLGATFVAILIGPWAAAIVMTCVIAVQGLLFQDGGLLVMGTNILNMGIVGAFLGYAVYSGVSRLLGKTSTAQLVSAGIGAWTSVVVGASACAVELALSGTSPLSIALPAMVGIHALIGIGEALITVSALIFIRQTRPDLLATRSASERDRGMGWVVVGILIAVTIAFASPLSNKNPDGLERVAQDSGFLSRARTASFEILPDYTVPFIQNESTTTIVAGVIGVLVVTGVGFAVGLGVRRRTS